MQAEYVAIAFDRNSTHFRHQDYSESRQTARPCLKTCNIRLRPS
jgi:5'-3' exonuclease